MNQNDKARAICIFSLILYCFDNGSDFFVSVDLFRKCHERYGACVLFFIVLPGIIYGFFKYFKMDSNERDWSDIFRCFIGYPIGFIPMSLWKLVKAVLNVGLDHYEETEIPYMYRRKYSFSTSSREENEAKW